MIKEKQLNKEIQKEQDYDYDNYYIRSYSFLCLIFYIKRYSWYTYFNKEGKKNEEVYKES